MRETIGDVSETKKIEFGDGHGVEDNEAVY